MEIIMETNSTQKKENSFYVDSDKLSEQALKRKHQLENDPSSRTDPFEYMPGMEHIKSDIQEKVIKAMNEYEYDKIYCFGCKKSIR